MFRELASDPKSDRAQLGRAIAVLHSDEVLLVTRLDRLAHSTRDLLNTFATITAKGAGFRSLSDAWADRTTPHGRLLVTILGGIGEFEQKLIRCRTTEGARANEDAWRQDGPKTQAHPASAAASH